MLRLKKLALVESKDALREIPEGKVLINSLNSYSYNVAQKDMLFAEALMRGNYLIPDGVGIVMACRWVGVKLRPKRRIAGWDLFESEMKRLDAEGASKRVMFMGSSEKVLSLIKQRAKTDYPNLEVITYSPPYKAEFSEEDNQAIISAINGADPDLLWIGMTAPKQEKWAYQHWQDLSIRCHVGTIGAVFDFYAGTVKRAPKWWQEHSIEWLYRLMKEPKRMWHRYVWGIPLFFWNIRKEIGIRHKGRIKLN